MHPFFFKLISQIDFLHLFSPDHFAQFNWIIYSCSINITFYRSSAISALLQMKYVTHTTNAWQLNNNKCCLLTWSCLFDADRLKSTVQHWWIHDVWMKASVCLTVDEQGNDDRDDQTHDHRHHDTHIQSHLVSSRSGWTTQNTKLS